MSPPDDSFIFVSYSSRDSDFVHSEIERLELQGYKFWYDKEELQPGRIWAEEISKAIRECACFIVFITQDAIASPYVLVEIEQALEMRKPFICIYWEKVDLPAQFRQPIRSIQALERYALRTSEYEEPLSRALNEYIKPIPPIPSEKNHDGRVESPVPPLPAWQSDILPKIFFFSLILLVVVFVFLAAAATMAPHLASYPGDPLGKRWVGLLVALSFIAIALGLGAGALAVYRVYIRRKNG
jgi:TIR domain